jgi:purine-binding chemotaxis protein CheW
MECVLMDTLAFDGPASFEESTGGSAQRVPNQFVTFAAGDNDYGIDIMAVREIRSWSPTTMLPGQPFGARGVLDIRGSVVEVYDLSTMLGGPQTEARPGQVVLVVALGTTTVGILVDSVSDIIFAREEDFRTAPRATQQGDRDGKVSGLVKHEDRLITILDLQALFPGYDREAAA